jgi:peptide-methionine (S)-S-oxide reductase
MENSQNNPSRWLAIFAATAIVGASALYFASVDGSAISVANAAEGKSIAPLAMPLTEAGNEQVAVFAGGCFWGVEGVYEHVAGVIRVESGYAGGDKADADYDKVSYGLTRHAEAVRIVYDPSRVSYATLLHIFFSVAHDPTQLDRQGPDSGKQYRSAIFPQSEAQERMAIDYIEQLEAAKSWRSPIVTRIEDGEFYPAEPYHQDYMAKNPNSGYIRSFDVPKVQALKHYFPNIYRGK